MKAIEIKIGEKYNSLTVIAEVARKNFNKRRFLCSCDCGENKEVDLLKLRSGTTNSCGCGRLERIKNLRRTHGKGHSGVNNVWHTIKQRCYNQNNKSYYNYGGRGIGMSDSWKDDFMNFYKDMGPREKDMTVERVNNDGDYCKENCVWADRKTQANNKRNNIKK